MPAVFITNDMLQQWSDQGKVRLDDTTLTLLGENRTVRLTPAVRFTQLIDGGDDPNKLIGKVKTTEQLGELGAEHYLDSVIFGDVGYTVVEGFLGDLSPVKRAAATKTPPKTAAPAPSALPPPTGVEGAEPDPFAPQATEVKLVVPRTTTQAPAAVELPPAPSPGEPTRTPGGTKTISEAEALSQLFLSTVKDIK